ncbi:MAG: hypothetical protein ACRDNK_16715, partial [Solirubrobacteraceae bacterium]
RRAAGARLRFEHDREQKAAITIAARDAMGRARDVERQAIAHALTQAAKALRAARADDALEVSWHAAAPYIDQAHAWKAARDVTAAQLNRDKHGAERQRRLQRESEQHVQRAERERKATQARATAAELRTIASQISRLERLKARKTTRPEESPLVVLSEPLLAGRPVLRFEREHRPAGRLDRFLYAYTTAIEGVTGSWTCTLDPALTFAGSETGCEQLTTWQTPGTQRVLATALRALRSREAQLGGPARSPRGARPKTPRAKPARTQSKKRTRTSTRRSTPARMPTAGRRPAVVTPTVGTEGRRVRCTQCGAIYSAQGWLGTRLTCSRCNAPVLPLA